MKKIYLSRTDDPYRNISTEMELLKGSDELSLFLWVNRPCVVAGFNQDTLSQWDSSVLKSEGILPVRRFTGGGTVYQDKGNLNYTFVFDKSKAGMAYCQQIIISRLSSLGVESELSGRNDIVSGSGKISGCAWKEEEDRMLFHGTLMVAVDISAMARALTPSSSKFEGKGIKSVAARVRNLSEICPGLTVQTLSDAIVKEFLARFSDVQIRETVPEDPEIARMISNDKFIYNRLDGIRFTDERKLKGGNVRMVLEVEGTEITQRVIYTDSMDLDYPQKVRRRLVGNSVLELEELLKNL